MKTPVKKFKRKI